MRKGNECKKVKTQNVLSLLQSDQSNLIHSLEKRLAYNLTKEKERLRKFFYYLSPKENYTYGIRILKHTAQKRIQNTPTDLGLQDSSGEQNPATFLSGSVFRRPGARQHSTFALQCGREPCIPLICLTHSRLHKIFVILHQKFFLQGIFQEDFGSIYRMTVQLCSNNLRSWCSSARCSNCLCKHSALFDCNFIQLKSPLLKLTKLSQFTNIDRLKACK